jgi:hypothetical protein
MEDGYHTSIFRAPHGVAYEDQHGLSRKGNYCSDGEGPDIHATYGKDTR